MNKDLISIIVPVYNVEKYLDKCIESIVNQTYKNIELILVDDGSPDNCPKMCDEWSQKDNRVKVIHKENGGLSSARNFGLEASTGEFVCFIDSDDWIDYNAIEELTKIIDDSTDFVSFGMLLEFDTETAQLVYADKKHTYFQKELFENFLNDNSVAGYACNKLFRKEIIGEERFDESLLSCEDIDFCTRIATICNKVIHTDAKFYHYRQRNDSMTGEYKYNVRKLSVLTAYENIMPIYKMYDSEDYYKLEINYLKIALNIKGRMILSKVKDDVVKNRLERIIKEYYRVVINNPNNSVSVKANIIVTRLFPGLLLRVKQLVLKKRRGLKND